MTLWYFETVGMTGKWGPCTAPERPQTVMQGGHLREKRVSGMGARIRRITEVPAAMHGMGPDEIRRAFWGDEDARAVAPASPSASGPDSAGATAWIT
jgi:hypothetical protein